MEEVTTVTSVSDDLSDNDPTDYSYELQELIRQGNDIINQSAEILQEVKHNNELHELEFNALNNINVVLFWFCALLGLVCGLLFVMVFKK